MFCLLNPGVCQEIINLKGRKKGSKGEREGRRKGEREEGKEGGRKGRKETIKVISFFYNL